jgi:VIT1/CCC1 family predicted Fe2+/Mn2+ transporter
MSLAGHWREEKRSAFLYRAIAANETAHAAKELFTKLAEAAESQAATWAAKMRASGDREPDEFDPGARARLVAGLVRLLGPRRMQPALAAMKVRGLSVYSSPSAIAGHAMPTSRADFGQRHRSVAAGGALRAAVFGINDGLVSNASLVLAMVGANAEPRTILITGLAGLLAGASSMAAGEWVSVRSQRELFEYQIGLEEAELAEYPEQEAEEIALIYRARGLAADEARTVARRLMADPKVALDTLAREELGLDPQGLGSPWVACGSSFLAFAIGAALPVAVFAATSHGIAVASASAAAAFLVGCALSLFTGRGVLASGLRMVAIGAAAALATWSIGRLFGVALA